MSAQAHTLLRQRLEAVHELYRPAAEFVETSKLAQAAEIEFNVEFVTGGVWNDFVDALDGRRTADLLDHLADSRRALKGDDAAAVQGFVSDVMSRLGNERGASNGTQRQLQLAFRKGVDAASRLTALFSLDWLQLRFGLTGRGRPLAQLSPGERGLILLLFYLLVDKSDYPLLLDQPEENLGNEDIRHLLVPALKIARSLRQVIMVTHNANLAIVGDADQVIHCRREDSFKVATGALTTRVTGETAILILEGSRDAFLNRQYKYETVMSPIEP